MQNLHTVSSKTLPSIGISHGRDHNRQDTRYQCWNALQSVRNVISSQHCGPVSRLLVITTVGIYLVGISVEGDFLHTAHGSLRRGVAQEKTAGVDRKIRCMLRRIIERRSANVTDLYS